MWGSCAVFCRNFGLSCLLSCDFPPPRHQSPRAVFRPCVGWETNNPRYSRSRPEAIRWGKDHVAGTAIEGWAEACHQGSSPPTLSFLEIFRTPHDLARTADGLALLPVRDSCLLRRVFPAAAVGPIWCIVKPDTVWKRRMTRISDGENCSTDNWPGVVIVVSWLRNFAARGWQSCRVWQLTFTSMFTRVWYLVPELLLMQLTHEF